MLVCDTKTTCNLYYYCCIKNPYKPIVMACYRLDLSRSKVNNRYQRQLFQNNDYF